MKDYRKGIVARAGRYQGRRTKGVEELAATPANNQIIKAK